MNTIASPDRPGMPSYAGRDIIKKLLEHGANPNTQLKLRRPEFRNAIGERGADNSLATGATPLLRAAHSADVETIESCSRTAPWSTCRTRLGSRRSWRRPGSV